MAAEGRGGRQLANSAPICFHERGEEISEDTMPERHARRQKGRLKIKLINILPVSPHEARFRRGRGAAAAIQRIFVGIKSSRLIRRRHVSPPVARSGHTDVAWSVESNFPPSLLLSSPSECLFFSSRAYCESKMQIAPFLRSFLFFFPPSNQCASNEV